MAKIAIIGAGSRFTGRLTVDILSWPELSDSTISLMDIDERKLQFTAQLAERVIAQEQWPAKIESTLDYREALEDADYVIVTLRVGGKKTNVQDVKIPLKYGVDQVFGETVGPGAVFYGLRQASVLLDICQDMEKLCPRALLINYANPMAINCWAMDEASSIRVIGLCHSVQGTAIQLARYIGAPYEEISYWVAGINHMAWFLRFEWNGEDAYPLLRKKLEESGGENQVEQEEEGEYLGKRWDEDTVRVETLRRFGYFVTESSLHMSQYVPYFRRTPEMVKEWLSESALRRQQYRRSLDKWMGRDDVRFEDMRQGIESHEPIKIERSREYCSRIIHSIETNIPYRFNGNVRNTGLITNLPPGCVVEVPCLADGTGIHPCYVGDLPPQCAALNRANISVHELAIKALLERDRGAVYQAVALDPLTAAVCSLEEVWEMVDELFQAESEWLPQMGSGPLRS